MNWLRDLIAAWRRHRRVARNVKRAREIMKSMMWDRRR